MSKLLEVKGLKKSYSKGLWHQEVTPVLKDVSFEIDKGETLALIGVSGSGKSTIGKILVGQIPFEEGSIQFKATNLLEGYKKERPFYAKKIQMLFQHPKSSINPRFTLAESMMEVFALHPELCRAEDRGELIHTYLSYVGLEASILNRYPHQVSGGQIQRLCLARIMLLEPELIILDEPTSMLDVSVQAQVMDLLKRYQEEKHISYLFITHDLYLASAYSDAIAVLHEGTIVENQRAQYLLTSPQTLYTKALIEAMSF